MIMLTPLPVARTEKKGLSIAERKDIHILTSQVTMSTWILLVIYGRIKVQLIMRKVQVG